MLRFAALACVAVLAGGADAALAATDGSTSASPTIVRQITHVSAHTLNAVGAGGIKANQGTQKSGAFTITKLHAAKRGKLLPVLLAADIAWCDHCAADSWSLAVALSRFGALHGLRQIDTGTYQSTHTGSSPLYDHLQGVSFYRARYSSKLLGLTSVTLQDLNGKPLAHLTKAQGRDLSGFDTAGFLPAFDVGGRYGIVNSGFTPLVLHGQSAATIASRIANGTSSIGQNIDGLANVFSAAICSATGQKPHAVCASPGVRAGGRVL
jgi:hypothetical protein